MMYADFLGIKFVPEINIGHIITVLLLVGGVLKAGKNWVDKSLAKFIEEQIGPIKIAAESASAELPKINASINEIKDDVGELRVEVAKIGHHDERIKRLEDAVYRSN